MTSDELRYFRHMLASRAREGLLKDLIPFTPTALDVFNVADIDAEARVYFYDRADKPTKRVAFDIFISEGRSRFWLQPNLDLTTRLPEPERESREEPPLSPPHSEG